MPVILIDLVQGRCFNIKHHKSTNLMEIAKLEYASPIHLCYLPRADDARSSTKPITKSNNIVKSSLISGSDITTINQSIHTTEMNNLKFSSTQKFAETFMETTYLTAEFLSTDIIQTAKFYHSIGTNLDKTPLTTDFSSELKETSKSGIMYASSTKFLQSSETSTKTETETASLKDSVSSLLTSKDRPRSSTKLKEICAILDGVLQCADERVIAKIRKYFEVINLKMFQSRKELKLIIAFLRSLA